MLNKTHSQSFFEDIKAFHNYKVNEDSIGCKFQTEGTHLQDFKLHGFEYPTFRGFVLACLEYILKCGSNDKCLLLSDVHFKPQYDTCLPCATNYEAILKV